MRQGQKVDFGVFIGQASFREPKELNPGDRFIQLDKHYDGPVALPPASGLSLPGLPIRSATKRACHAVDGRERSREKQVQSQGLSPRSSAGLLFGLLARTCDRHRHRRRGILLRWPFLRAYGVSCQVTKFTLSALASAASISWAASILF